MTRYLKHYYFQVQATQSKIENEPTIQSPELKSPAPIAAIKESTKTNCIVCKKAARASSIYCSNSCIWKHAQDSLGNQSPSTKADGEPGKSSEKQKPESRVSNNYIPNTSNDRQSHWSSHH